MPENGTHGSIGGRWRGDHDHDRDGRETFGPAPDVVTPGAEPAAYLTCCGCDQTQGAHGAWVFQGGMQRGHAAHRLTYHCEVITEKCQADEDGIGAEQLCRSGRDSGNRLAYTALIEYCDAALSSQ